MDGRIILTLPFYLWPGFPIIFPICYLEFMCLHACWVYSSNRFMPVFNSWTILVFEKLLDTKLVRNSGHFVDHKGSLLYLF
jgi:hypothetical protein